jgi:outer membrane protein TolC
MAASNARIGVATAAYFPTLTLSGSDNYTAGAFSHLLSAPNRIWSLGPELAETLIDGGLRRAQVAGARAAYQATLANYRETVLASFQQVEDQIVTLRILEKQAVIEDAAVGAAKEAERLTLNQYKAGTVPYSSVITAQTTRLSSEETALTVLSDRLQASIGLIQAAPQHGATVPQATATYSRRCRFRQRPKAGSANGFYVPQTTQQRD